MASQFSLGSIYSTGTGSISRDPKRAAQLYHAAAEQGHVRAQMSLAQAYMNGVGVPQVTVSAPANVPTNAANFCPQN